MCYLPFLKNSHVPKDYYDEKQQLYFQPWLMYTISSDWCFQISVACMHACMQKKGLKDLCDLGEVPECVMYLGFAALNVWKNLYLSKKGLWLWYSNNLVFSCHKSQGMHKRQITNSMVKTKAAEAEVLQLLLPSVV